MDTTNINTIARSKQLQNPILQVILLFIAGAVFWYFLLAPKYIDYTVKRTELADVKKQQSTLESEQIELDRLISKLKSSESEVRLLDEAVPLSNRPTKIAVLLESYARSSSLELSGINIENIDEAIAAGDKAKLDDPYSGDHGLVTLKVSVSVSGTIDQFKNFLELLETSGRLVDVDNLDVTSADGLTKFTVNLKTYAYEPK